MTESNFQDRLDDEDQGIRAVTDPERQRSAILRAIELGFLRPADDRPDVEPDQ
ncbi:hypothetical protein [Pseudoclavibacter terrae]|uniref:hypothetical protein n=1 Tax=Pseudoclavibacter terrae TaxID=1530195 RepID=UPI00232EAFEC|nr:hypothetical protein [Pseudoclavibacter terrae]